MDTTDRIAKLLDGIADYQRRLDNAEKISISIVATYLTLIELHEKEIVALCSVS